MHMPAMKVSHSRRKESRKRGDLLDDILTSNREISQACKERKINMKMVSEVSFLIQNKAKSDRTCRKAISIFL